MPSFHADEGEEVYCQPPDEWHDGNRRREGKAWGLKQQICGRWKAARRFLEHVVCTLTEKCGLETSAAAPRLLRISR